MRRSEDAYGFFCFMVVVAFALAWTIIHARGDDETPPRPPAAERLEDLLEPFDAREPRQDGMDEPSGFDIDAMANIIHAYNYKRERGEAGIIIKLAREYKVYCKLTKCRECGKPIKRTVCGYCKECTIRAMSPD